jgi:hypothetical protein
MSYTTGSDERAEVDWSLVLLVRRRKLTGVRPGCMIVATYIEREHAKETCR